MIKEDNEWDIEEYTEEYNIPDGHPGNIRTVNINGESYNCSSQNAALCHAILLLVDAINDKDFS